MSRPPNTDLRNLGEGVAGELWSAALREVLGNIDDPNTDWKQKRTITLTFAFVADETRRATDVEVRCSTKLAGVRPKGTRLFIGHRPEGFVAVEALPQSDLFKSTEPAQLGVVEGQATDSAGRQAAEDGGAR